MGARCGGGGTISRGSSGGRGDAPTPLDGFRHLDRLCVRPELGLGDGPDAGVRGDDRPALAGNPLALHSRQPGGCHRHARRRRGGRSGCGSTPVGVVGPVERLRGRGALGGAWAAAFEWYGRATGRWTCADRMPVVPLLGVGLWPLLQLAVLIPTALWIARRHGRSSNAQVGSPPADTGNSTTTSASHRPPRSNRPPRTRE
jgi:hypothetical protein